MLHHWIMKNDVDLLSGVGVVRAETFHIGAEKNHQVKGTLLERVNVLCAFSLHVDALLGHYGSRHRMNHHRNRPGGKGGPGIAEAVVHERLGHLGACRIARADKQDGPETPGFRIGESRQLAAGRGGWGR